MNRLLIAAFSALLCFCPPVNADVVHTEFVLDANGEVIFDENNQPVYQLIGGNELSGDPDAPTQLSFELGDNTVFGIINGAPTVTFENSAFLTGDDYDPSTNVDIYTFNVAAGQQLDSLTVEYFDNANDNLAFIAIQDDATFPLNAIELGLLNFSGGATDQYLGGSTFGSSAASSDVGVDILPRLAASGNVPGSSGFSAPLGPGDYTIYLQQTGAATPYGITIGITAIPEPSTCLPWIMTSTFVTRRRTRK